MKNLKAHTTFLHIINLLVVAGILCLLAPNAVDRNRESTFEEWMESSQVEDASSQESSDVIQEDSEGSSTANSGDPDSKHEITSLYAAWYYFHQSVTLGHGVVFDASSWKHLKLAKASSLSSDFSDFLIHFDSEHPSYLSGNFYSDHHGDIPSDHNNIRHSLNINAP